MIDRSYARMADWISRFLGSVWSIVILLAAITLTGIYFEFSARWETRLVTVMAVLALLAVLFLQRSQRHGDKATHLKLDELIKAVDGARDEISAVEEEPEHVIDTIRHNNHSSQAPAPTDRT